MEPISIKKFLIEAYNLTKEFGSVKAVADLNLSIAEGEIYGLMGPDGAGKTTTMRLLCGVLKPTLGEVRIGGYDLHKNTEEARSLIGYLPQRFALYDELSVKENLRFFAEVRSLSAAKWQPRCKEILEFVGLGEFLTRKAGHLSGGMKQKLGLAVALVHNPQVLLLDEPTTGVDPATRQDFWQLILTLVLEERVAVLVSTPYMEEAERCTQVGFLMKGRLLVENSPNELTKLFPGDLIELYGSPLSLLRSLAESDKCVQSVQSYSDRLHLHVSEGMSTEVITRLEKAIISEGGIITRLSKGKPKLEDVFFSLLEMKEGKRNPYGST